MGSVCSNHDMDREASSPEKDASNGYVLSNGPIPTEKEVQGSPLPPLTLLMEHRDNCGERSQEMSAAAATSLSAVVSRLESAVERLERIGTATTDNPAHGTPSAAVDETCTVPFVVAYDELLSGPFKVFLNCSSEIGGDLAEISKIVEATFKTQRAFLVAVAKSQKPSDDEFPKVLEPTGKKIEDVIKYRESHRTSPFFNHLSAISESIPGLSWVTMSPAPGPYVKDMGDAAVFYTNRVLKDYREKDKIHVEWVQNWNNVFKELQEYIKQYHTTGISWNPRGGRALDNLKAPPGVGILPPPSGIPPPPPMIPLQPKALEEDGHAALFADINKGLDITSGLKKVPDEMKTHKNPALREGPKPYVKHSAPPSQKTPSSNTQQVQPPKLALEGKKWFVEYQKHKPSLTVTQTSMDHTVYMYKCENTVLQVKGKVNSITLDSCKKCSILFDSVVAAVEIVNCQSCQIQVVFKVPTISIEKTDGCQVYLSKDSLDVEVISAKSTEMNILVPNKDGEFTELAIPEQYKTTIVGNRLQTVCTEMA